MARLRAALRVVGRALASGPGAGALFMVGLFVLDLVESDVGFMGLHDKRAIAAVTELARSHAIRQELLILATLIVAGLLMGTVGALAGLWWDWALARKRPRFGALRGLAATIVLHGYFLARSIQHYPQLYSRRFYGGGGLRRTLMVFVTDRLPAAVLSGGLALVLALAFVAPLLTRRARGELPTRMRQLLDRARQRWRLAVAVALALMAAATLTLVLAGPGRRRAAQRARPNVLVLAIDSLRADRIFAADAASRFPTLAGLATRGVRFREAYVTQARTMSSFTTLLTGRYSYHHGIRHEFPSPSARAGIGATLPKVLHAAGFRTAAVSDFSGEIFRRVPYGFDDVDAPLLDLYAIVQQTILQSQVHVLPYATSSLGRPLYPELGSLAELNDPALLADRALAHLDELAPDPFFMVVFFSAAHSPYVGPAPFYKQFSDPAYHGPYKYLKEPLPLLPTVPPQDARQVQDLYDGAVASCDAAIARILARLEADGLADNTIIVLLGDHGENLFEVPGRGMGHGEHLWGSIANHIPLVVVDPRHAAPHDVWGIVRDIDVAPTLAALAGAPAPAGSDGVDLAPLLAGTRSTLDLDAYAETGTWLLTAGPGFARSERLPYPDVWNITMADDDGDIYMQPAWEDPVVAAKVRALRTPGWKLVYQPAPEGAHWRLFDTNADPEETDDVAAAHPTEVAAMRAKLAAWITADGHTRVVPDAPSPP